MLLAGGHLLLYGGDAGPPQIQRFQPKPSFTRKASAAPPKNPDGFASSTTNLFDEHRGVCEGFLNLPDRDCILDFKTSSYFYNL